MKVVFDVNETLLDLSSLDIPFEQALGESTARNEWFARLLHLSVLVTALDTYRDFRTLAEDALAVVAAKRGIVVDPADKDRIFETFRSLPPYPDVRPAIEYLTSAGVGVAALTNSPLSTVEPQLLDAGLTPLFDEIMSVESTRRFKPHPAPYLMAAQRLGEDPADLWMVAVHDWDVAAAMKVGFRGAFLARPGHIVTSSVEEPDLICSNLEELAEALIDRA